MRTLSAVLDDKTNSGPARLEKQSRAIDEGDSFFVVKYVSLGQSHRPIIKVIKYLQKILQVEMAVPFRHLQPSNKSAGEITRGSPMEILLGSC